MMEAKLSNAPLRRTYTSSTNLDSGLKESFGDIQRVSKPQDIIVCPSLGYHHLAIISVFIQKKKHVETYEKFTWKEMRLWHKWEKSLLSKVVS